MYLVAFEAINSVRLEIRLSVEDRKGAADVCATVVAHSRKVEIGEAPPLGSVSADLTTMNRKTLEDALIQLLYRLDGQLASGEFASVLTK